MFKHELGKEAKDKITGFTGIIIGRAQHLTGCNTYGLAPRKFTDGKRPETEWFDEGRIQITGTGISAKEVKGSENGGDHKDNPR